MDVIQYADDSTLILPYNDLNELNKLVKDIENKLASYLSGHNLYLNLNKTEIMLFGDKTITEIDFMHQKIQVVNHTKFLGLLLSNNRTLNYHIENNIVPEIRQNYYIFSHVTKYLNKQDKINIFQSFIFPHI